MLFVHFFCSLLPPLYLPHWGRLREGEDIASVLCATLIVNFAIKQEQSDACISSVEREQNQRS